MNKLTVGLLSLGCKVNSCESEQIREDLLKAGFLVTDFENKADAYVVNTCSVTNIADRKSRQMLHKARKQNPEAVILATGCYAQLEGERKGSFPDADIVVGNNHKREIAEILVRYLDNKASDSMRVEKIGDEKCFEEMSLCEYPERVRAFVKVEDGCNQFCSYCIIPYARGRVRSRSIESVMEEVRKLAEEGFCEVVLTGIHLSSYGFSNYEGMINNKDNPDVPESFDSGPLLELINRVSSVDGIDRIRLGSLEPRIITEPFAKALAANKKVCPHFHLSLQSGCNSVLKRMNRHYTSEDFLERCRILREAFDRPAITTDVIVGFPGESEEEFKTSLEMLEKMRFSKMHIFKYSSREGTIAAKMEGQLTENEKHIRSEQVQELDERLHREYLEGFLGNTEEVLVEEAVEGGFRGLNSRYVDIFFKTSTENEKININSTYKIRVLSVDGDRLLGEPVNG